MISYDEALTRWARKWVAAEHPNIAPHVDWTQPVALAFNMADGTQYSEVTWDSGFAYVSVTVAGLGWEKRWPEPGEVFIPKPASYTLRYGEISEDSHDTEFLPNLIRAILAEAEGN